MTITKGSERGVEAGFAVTSGKEKQYSNSVELLVLKDQQKAACARESSGATEKEWGMRLCRSLQSVFCLE